MKTHTHLINLAVLAIAALMYLALISPLSVMSLSGAGASPVYRTLDEDEAGLIIRLSWDAAACERILDELESAGVKATFAVTSEWTEKHAELIARLKRDGHETAALFTPGTGERDEAELREDIRSAADSIERVLGERPDICICGVEAEARAACNEGLCAVIPTVDINCSFGSAFELADRAEAVYCGSFVVCDPTAAFADALPFFLEKIKNMGLDIVSVHKMLYN